MYRAILTLLSAALLLAVTGCGVVRGAKDINTEPPSEGVGSGAGILSGKRGGMVIYQK